MRKITILIALFVFFGFQLVQAQLRVVTGKVTHKDDGSSLPGVTVLLKGTTIGTVTNVDGFYELHVPASGKTIVFQYVGMKPKEVTIGTSNTVNVVMEPDVFNIEGVVVTAIGIQRETKALGYSVQEIGNEALTKTNNANIVNSIGGKVAGVKVTSSTGAAGGASHITIRGEASIGGNNQPLFVVDGIPINNDELYTGNSDDGSNNLLKGVANSNRAIDLNPDDIATISVLKGGAATALYGLRAANGAIIITTKKGVSTKGKKIHVTFNSSYSIDKVNKLPELTKEFGQGRGGLYFGPETGTSFTWGPKLDTMGYYTNKTNPLDPKNPGIYKWDKNGALISVNDPNYNGTIANKYDNLEDFFRTGSTFSNSLSIGGGSDVATYYFSLSDLKQSGVIPNNEYRKTSAKIHGDAKISDKIRASGSVNYLKSGGDRIQQGSNLSGVMLGLLRTPASFDNSNGYKDPLNEPLAYMFPDGTQRTYRGGTGYDNPWWTVNRNIHTDDVNRIIGNVNLTYTPLEWISISYRLGNDFYTDRRKNYFAINSREKISGQVSEDMHFLQDITSDLIINVRRDLTKDIKLIATAGQNMYSHYYQNQYTQGNGLTVPDFYHLTNASAVLGRESIVRKRTAAFYADLGLSYQSMAFINITGREEWSTTLSPDKNRFFYPSASGSFVFTELPMLKENKYLPFGKIRASYALIANDAAVYGTKTYFGNSAFGDGWTDGIAFPFLGLPGFDLSSTLGNPDLGPEKLTSREIGLDLRFWKNRLGIDLTYYNNTSEDLLLFVPLAASTGYLSQLMNAASLENKGIELTLNITPLKTKDYQWDIAFNFTRNRSMVTELAPGVEVISLGGFSDPSVRVVKDKPYGSVYGTQWAKDGNGNVLIIDDPNDPFYGYPYMAQEEGFLGSIQPDWLGGINNEFRYKNFTFSFLIDIKQGGLMWNGTKGALYYFGTHKDTESRDDGKTYVFKGVLESTGAVNDIKVALDENWHRLGEGSGFTGPAEPFLEDASWVRLKEVYLSYNIASSLLDKTLIREAQVFVSGRNLWLSTDYTGIDPETSLMGSANAQGFDYFNMPNTKSFTFGVKLGF